ncbi:MAG: hypothetical protein GX900_06245 [Clostridiaceae bacterium]|nr:hypothetical protein [Clostridiaceae bacterium]
MSRRFRFEVPTDGRSMAAQVLHNLIETAPNSDLSELIRQASGGLDRREIGLGLAIIYGTLTYIYPIEYVIAQLSSRPFEELTPFLRTVLRLSFWQLIYADRLPASAVVNEAGKLLHRYTHRGNVNYANAILRAYLRQPIEIPADRSDLRFGLSPDMTDAFIEWYGSEAADTILTALLERPPLTVRVNRSRAEPEQVKADLIARGIEPHPARFMSGAYHLALNESRLTESDSWRRGWITVQGEAAQCAGSICRPQLGQTVLDACAAPGGKTAQIIESLILLEKLGTSKRSRVIATDLSEQRLVKLNETLSRLRLSDYPGLTVRVENAADKTGKQPEAYDWILLDVPCSALGIIAGSPDIRLNKSRESLNELLPLQADMLEAAAYQLRRQGYIIYCTCTLNPAENQEQIARFLSGAAGSDFSPVDLTEYLPTKLLALLDDGLPGKETIRQGQMTFLPGYHGTEGFFISLMKRN